MLKFMILIFLMLGIIFFIIGGNSKKSIKWIGVAFIFSYIIYIIPNIIDVIL